MPPEQEAVRRQDAKDELLLQKGVDPEAAIRDPSAIIALARRLHRHFEQAKTTQNLSDAVRYFYQKIDATSHELRNIPIACGQGCSHCCIIWVGVSAPEAIHAARLVAAMGGSAIAKVRAANEFTKQFAFEERDQHPHDCPMLHNNSCTIYEHRPQACRQAVSGDAQICARSYRKLTKEGIPTPALYLRSRATYAMALYAALAQSSLDSVSYEFNAAMVRVLDTPDAERRWLAGEDIFAGVLREQDSPPELERRIAFIRDQAFARQR